MTATSSKFVLCILLSLTCIYGLRSQEALKFYHLGTEEGLSHSWARSVAIDAQGYLWVGTVNGLNRYDGKLFKVYKNQPGTLQSLSDNFIQTIAEDSRGNLWIGTYRGGINRYDHRTESFVQYVHISDSIDVNDNRVHCIYEDSKGRLWVGTKRGILLFDYEADTFSNFKSDLIGGPVLSLSGDESGRLWAGTDRGLFQVDLLANTVKVYTQSSGKGLPGNHIRALCKDQTGQLWIGTLGTGLSLYDPVTDSFISFTETSGGNSRLSNNRILSLSGDHFGNLFIGTEGGGVNLMDTQTKTIRILMPQADDPNSLNSNSIHSIFHDPATQITWFGSYHGGVNYFSRRSKPFTVYNAEKGSLSSNNVLCVQEKGGKIYVGTDGGGLNIIDRVTGQVRILNSKGANPIQSDAVLSVLVDSRDQVWIGTFNGGLDCLLPDGRIQSYRYNPYHPKSLSAVDISAIYEDRKGRLWIGTMKGGLNLFHPSVGEFSRYQFREGDPTSLRDEFVSYITEDQEGNLLIQTGKSLDLYDPEREVFRDFSADYQVTLGQPISTFVDSRGNVWSGTREALYFFPGNKGEARIFTIADGLPTNSITGILEDTDQNLWIGTMKGLVKCTGAINDQDSLVVHIYTREDGLQGNEFKDQACFKGSDGTMYFGGQNGLISFKPWEIHGNPKPPEVVFTGFKLFNREVSFGEGSVIEAPISEAPDVHLTHRHNVFTIEFSALNFHLQSKNLYAYKMQGFEEDWNYVGNQTSATYTNLNPGTYTFRVKASNNDGVWNEQGASLTILISPPWWGTTWFKILAALSGVAIVVLIFRIRLHQMNRRQKILKRQVVDATREIQQVNELLEQRNEEIETQNASLWNKNSQLIQQNEELENQAQKIQNLFTELSMTKSKLAVSEKMASIGVFTAGIAHEINNPVNFISGATQNLFDLLDDTLTLEQKAGETGQTIEELREIIKIGIKRTTDIVNSLRNYSNSSDHFEMYDIIKCLDDTLMILSNQLKYSRIEVIRNTPESLVINCRPGRINQVLMNLVANAIDAIEDKGEIEIAMHYQSKSEIRLTVRDTGVGIEEKHLDKLFDPFFTTKEVGRGTGLGLYLVYGIVDEHKGQIEVKSSPEGTTFEILLPVDPKAK